jgi:ankyrin repeat protein
MTRLLLEHGADPSTLTGEGKSALDLARESNAEEVVRLLSS